jgi:hypothetical protein
LHNQTKGTRKCHDSGDTKYKAQVEISMIVINYGDDPRGLLNPIYFIKSNCFTGGSEVMFGD